MAEFQNIANSKRHAREAQLEDHWTIEIEKRVVDPNHGQTIMAIIFFWLAWC